MTSIGWGAFAGCQGLTSPVYNAHCFAYLPTSYKGAFTIPEGIKQIAGGAFDSCENLTSVTIPNSVTSIGNGAFSGCSSLTSITIPNSVTSIGWGAFSDCSSLTSVTIGNSVTSIGANTLNNTAIFKNPSNWENGALYINNCLISVDRNWMGDYKVKENTRLIAGTAFLECESLTSVTIPNSVMSIGDGAFWDCSSLTSVTIPNSVTSIGRDAFSGCTGLTSIVVQNGNPIYDSRNNCNAIIETATNTLIAGCNKTIIPYTVTSIVEGAFWGCSSLTSVTIPNSVTSIGRDAFSGCTGLTSIVVQNGNPIYDSRNNCNAIIETATNTLIAGCNKTIIPYSVTSIGDGAFSDCSGLTSITIPNSVTSIGYYAFDGCESLKSVIVPSHTKIAFSTFPEHTQIIRK